MAEGLATDGGGEEGSQRVRKKLRLRLRKTITMTITSLSLTITIHHHSAIQVQPFLMHQKCRAPISSVFEVTPQRSTSHHFVVIIMTT